MAKQYITREVGYEALMAAIIEQAREDAKIANKRANEAYAEMKKIPYNNAHKRTFEKMVLRFTKEKEDAEEAVREWRKELEDLLLPSIY